MKARILIVDDEREIRELLSRHFRYLGYEVSLACDGLDALAQMEDARVDIVISDIKMPRMDGVMLLERLRREYPMVRVIMMTGHVVQEAILACMREGAETCIFKPLQDLTEMEQAVSQAVQTIQRWWEILGELRALKAGASSDG